jgi:hypothetical protein
LKIFSHPGCFYDESIVEKFSEITELAEHTWRIHAAEVRPSTLTRIFVVNRASILLLD